ncbi:MAG: HAMP domain-containing histidine kinase [Clostridiales bacterium]|nr:HAMP domain-containing histidine kinase [Clostridiales bacterium]
MKKMKIFPKTFLYTLGLLLFIVGIAHLLLYVFIPHEIMDITIKTNEQISLSTDFNVAPYVRQTIVNALPLSLVCSIIISVVCSLLFSRKITVPIKHINAVTGLMAQMEKDAFCNISSKDEIGVLADNINHLYQSLLSAIHNLEIEKQNVIESEKSKIDFLQAASHELKTPVTALNATLENMILGIGKYKDYDIYLPECKEMTEQLANMIHDILETSRLSISSENEKEVEINLSEILSVLCEPYILIAKAKGIIFTLELSEDCMAVLPQRMFEKAVSNILANAITYTEAGKTVSVYFNAKKLIIENECLPIPAETLRHLFEPFYRPDFARNRDSGGNGLGLYIVATLFQVMDISYSFNQMEQPQGMRFTINLK